MQYLLVIHDRSLVLLICLSVFCLSIHRAIRIAVCLTVCLFIFLFHVCQQGLLAYQSLKSNFNTSIWRKISAESLHLQMHGFNPAYCCGGWANLLHTCYPPEAGTLSYSVLFICALPSQRRADCQSSGVHVCVCLHKCVCVLYMHTCGRLRQTAPTSVSQTLGRLSASRGRRANLVIIC